jgi:hypothetical protein
MGVENLSKWSRASLSSIIEASGKLGRDAQRRFNTATAALGPSLTQYLRKAREIGTRTLRRLVHALWVTLALIFLFEAWLWDHLRPVVAYVVDLVPWRRLKARMTLAIRALSPNATLVVFIIPVIVILPIKVMEIWLLALGHWLSALALLIFSKLLAMGILAFIFDLTRAKLLRIAWFHRLYNTVMWLRDWAHAKVEPVREQLKRWGAASASEQSSRAYRLFMRLRRRMQTHTAR